MKDPIVILMTGRCGSSMVAEVFAKHGVWHGDPSRGGYPKCTFENPKIKRLIQANMGWNFLDPVKASPPMRQQIEDTITKQGYIDGPWLFKQGAQYYRIWDEWEPRFVFVRRPLKAILSSYRRCMWLDKKYTPEEILWFVQRSHDIMDRMDGVNVYVDEVMAGDFKSLDAALSHCGIKFDAATAKEVINPELWSG